MLSLGLLPLHTAAGAESVESAPASRDRLPGNYGSLLGKFALASALLGGGSPIAQPCDMAAALPPQALAAMEKGDYAAAQAEIIAALKTLGQIEPADGKALALSIALETIRETGADVMAAFAAKSKPQRLFLAEFMKDGAWQELYLSCGLVPHQTDVGLQTLFDIWKQEKGQVRNKPLAVALASVWGGGETAPKPNIQRKNPARYNPVWRYEFFQKQAAKGAMHPNYKNLKPWELRFVVGIPGQDWDDGSYEWAAENINLPWDRYGWACWAAVYTDPSRFGDSVQSGAYNLPYSDISWGEATQRNGGVCGALSHLGCVAAMAHGIPAYTVGQPGHCAYAVRPERGKWTGGFGGPDGGMHNHIFGEKAPTSYLLMEKVFGDDAAIAKAYRYSFCARAREAAGDVKGAKAAWEQALEASPLHPFFRAQLHRLMLQDGLFSLGAYEYLMETIPLYEGNGYSAVALEKDFADLIQGMSDQQKADIFAKEHEMIAGTPGSWAVKSEDMIQAQSDALRSEEAKAQFLETLLTTHISKGDGAMFGQALEWAVKEYVEKGREDVFGKAFAKAAESATAVADQDQGKKMQEAYGKAIIAAEQARSASAFQALSAAAAKTCGACPSKYVLAQPAGIKGKAAQAALFRISTTSQWDTPIFHQSICTAQGGKCHTAREEKPSFIIELPGRASLTGCVVRKVDGFESRMKKAAVYTSEDGATWKLRKEIDNMPKEWVVDFPDGTPGKWVKVEFDNTAAPDFAHISHFVIFTK